MNENMLIQTTFALHLAFRMSERRKIDCDLTLNTKLFPNINTQTEVNVWHVTVQMIKDNCCMD